MDRINHGIPPVYDENSKILILGSFPSPLSRKYGFFYGHPQNRFWKVISNVLNHPLPTTVDEKKTMLLSNGIALWDVISSCEIVGAMDSSIKNAVPNDFNLIFQKADIKAVFTTGKTAYKLYQKFTQNTPILLPSPSPANCQLSIENLINAYSVILEYLK